MKLYVKEQNLVSAVELTAENLEAVERWSEGFVKPDGVHDIAKIGDYIVKDGTGAFSVLDAEQFVADYVLHDAAGIDQMKLLREEVEKWQGLAMMFMWRMAGANPMVLSKESIDAFQAHFVDTLPVLQATESSDGIQFQLVSVSSTKAAPDGN